MQNFLIIIHLENINSWHLYLYSIYAEDVQYLTIQPIYIYLLNKIYLNNITLLLAFMLISTHVKCNGGVYMLWCNDTLKIV